MMFKTVFALCFLGMSSAFLLDNDPEDWNELKVTWGMNPLTSFTSMPRTEKDALDEGFVKLSSCDETSKWRGNRYIKDDDTVVILLFDKNGYIAGIQSGIEEDPNSGFPKKLTDGPFIKEGDKYYATAYFTNPDIICSTGRSQSQFQSNGTGTEVLIQTGPDPVNDFMEIPLKESNVADTKFVKGQCFKSMGQHYWYNYHKDSACETLFPAFALYNGGYLNAFGFAFYKDVDSPRVEHPPTAVITKFMKEDKIPSCVFPPNATRLSTMHVYLTSKPYLNWC